MPLAFRLDARSCSGCKACEVACRDRNALPPGVHWRRVYELSGGGWRREGEAWRNDAFAWNLSLSCNHCEHPICVEVCPTRALQQRTDGLVLLDQRRCIGCRYCEWACPYGAPQYDAIRGGMSKCHGCAEDLALGLPPACVAACGLRSLEFGELQQLARLSPSANLEAIGQPLPPPDLTGPRLLLVPHARAAHAQAGARVANLEEVGGRPPRREPSLVAFTVLVQAAVGLYWAWLAARWAGATPAAGANLPLWAVGPLLVAGVLASLLHLGRPHNAWRVLANLRTSWLSREILLTALFALGWLLSVVLARNPAPPSPTPWTEFAHTVVALLGLALIHAMARVYRLRTVPGWNTLRTLQGFLLTALALGAACAAPLLQARAHDTAALSALVAVLGVTAAVAVILRGRFYARHPRAGL